MKWGRKKHTSASSPQHHHSISHLFPVSWFTKFKLTGNKPPKSKILKENPKGKQSLLRSSRSPKHSSPKRSGFHGRDDNGLQRVSFGKENIDGGSRGGTPMSASYNSGKEVEFLQDCEMNGTPTGSEASGKNKKNKKNPKLIKTEQRPKEMSPDIEISPDTDFGSVVVNGKQKNRAAKHENLGRTYLRIMKATQDLQRELEEAKEDYRRSVEKDAFELESEETGVVMGRAHRNSSCLSSGKQNHVTPNSTSFYDDSVCEVIKTGNNMALYAEELNSPEMYKSKNVRRKEAIAVTEKQRKSVHIRRESQRKQGRVRVCSPRPTSKTEICKIKAIEDLKKAKLKKKKIKEQPSGETQASQNSSQDIEYFDSFAVVKCSVNPVEDFRDSMFEMIMERRIRKAEDLEELLACYLTLNADEYHDLIIKVFRQVWSDLEEAYYTKKSEIQDLS